MDDALKKEPQGPKPSGKGQTLRTGGRSIEASGRGSPATCSSGADLLTKVKTLAVPEIEVEGFNVLDARISHATSRDPIQRRAVDSCVCRYRREVRMSQTLYNVAVD
jgi:hypothetical protein